MLDNIIVKYLITFFLGMCPIIEIRGAIPVGVGLGLSYFESFVVGFIGNIIPIYFIVKHFSQLFCIKVLLHLFKSVPSPGVRVSTVTSMGIFTIGICIITLMGTHRLIVIFCQYRCYTKHCQCNQ